MTSWLGCANWPHSVGWTATALRIAARRNTGNRANLADVANVRNAGPGGDLRGIARVVGVLQFNYSVGWGGVDVFVFIGLWPKVP